MYNFNYLKFSNSNLSIIEYIIQKRYVFQYMYYNIFFCIIILSWLSWCLYHYISWYAMNLYTPSVRRLDSKSPLHFPGARKLMTSQDTKIKINTNNLKELSLSPLKTIARCELLAWDWRLVSPNKWCLQCHHAEGPVFADAIILPARREPATIYQLTHWPLGDVTDIESLAFN